MGTVAVQVEEMLECTEDSEQLYRWWLTVLIVDVILGWIVLTFFVCSCCAFCFVWYEIDSKTDKENFDKISLHYTL